MITRIEALNYKCLRYVKQDLGNFHVLAGPNASGKSTFLDAIAFMADVVINRGPLEAVGKRASDYRELFWMRQGDRFELAIEASIPEERRRESEDASYERCRYELSIGTLPRSDEIGILSERLWLFKPKPAKPEQLDVFPRVYVHPQSILWRTERGRKPLVNKVPDGKDNFYSETGGYNLTFRLGPHKSALANLPEDIEKFPISTWFKKTLSEGVQVLTLNSSRMRFPSATWVGRRLLPDGSNLAWPVSDLRGAGSDRFQQWLAHIRTVLHDIADIKTIEREEDRSRYLVLRYSTGVEIPSWLISDGTLRFLALTLLPYLPGMQGIYLIEEPENGIHPRALEAVHQSLSSVYDGQVLLATHSPIFLSVSKLSQVLCFALNEEGAADVVEGTGHPKLRHWRNEVPLGDLLAAGVLG